jgi:spore germination protein GerM
MTRQRIAVAAGVAAVVIVLAAFGIAQLRRRGGSEAATSPGAAPAPPPAQAESRRIKATLYYVGENGERLVGVERDVPYGASPAEQARRIVEEQLKDAPAPLASAVPKGTSLRALFLSGADAYVDLSPEISSGHEGGSLEEILTVYALVNALTTNLPAVERVQILVAGREVDTLAGHVDLRRPLQKNLKWATP